MAPPEKRDSRCRHLASKMCEVGEELFGHEDKERNNAHVEVSIHGGEKMSHALFREDRLKVSIYSCDSLK